MCDFTAAKTSLRPQYTDHASQYLTARSISRISGRCTGTEAGYREIHEILAKLIAVASPASPLDFVIETF